MDGGEEEDRGADADQDLWQRVAHSAKPLSKRNRLASGAPPAPKAAKPQRKSAPQTKTSSPQKPKPLPPPSPAPLPVSLDRREARALDKGRLAIEARLDLHGLRQSDAHAALRRFLKQAQSDGLRHVLVITGKGSERAPGKRFHAEEPRGVLRQQVPHWLGQPEFASVVVSFAQAPRRLGGEGALYVRLKKLRD
jgi:DNA-nicking Smr family endonuclease